MTAPRVEAAHQLAIEEVHARRALELLFDFVARRAEIRVEVDRRTSVARMLDPTGIAENLERAQATALAARVELRKALREAPTGFRLDTDAMELFENLVRDWQAQATKAVQEFAELDGWTPRGDRVKRRAIRNRLNTISKKLSDGHDNCEEILTDGGNHSGRDVYVAAARRFSSTAHRLTAWMAKEAAATNFFAPDISEESMHHAEEILAELVESPDVEQLRLIHGLNTWVAEAESSIASHEARYKLVGAWDHFLGDPASLDESERSVVSMARELLTPPGGNLSPQSLLADAQHILSKGPTQTPMYRA